MPKKLDPLWMICWGKNDEALADPVEVGIREEIALDTVDRSKTGGMRGGVSHKGLGRIGSYKGTERRGQHEECQAQNRNRAGAMVREHHLNGSNAGYPPGLQAAADLSEPLRRHFNEAKLLEQRNQVTCQRKANMRPEMRL